ncbi:MAG: hypothetical protein A2798_02590 [Candidatus Levybacteria bacterium RIFCSPHIGHO2_01_FULL_37_17]|nr:MAG: hypothetical protein A2798_02590 [Candidatus Levybacteria bacterium RIFCSPHIGHO2_01_FULL_37_17]OGH36755.1 MAG: hypothetical protein A2959_00580 [Candidatus Levybacteria bacterium RIFCSPLOWO2_01_FULL_38_23]
MESAERQKINQQAEFVTDTFEIKFLSRSADGLEIVTDQKLLRHAPNTPLPFAERIAKERAREKKQFRTGTDFAPKVGIRNPRLEGNQLIVDVMPVTFPTFKAISEADISTNEREIANPSATSLILVTTEPDGSHKFILQHRSPKNFFYGDIPGASAAGYLDAKLHTTGNDKGKIDAVTTDSIKANGAKEMREEIGLYPRDIEDLKITGLASDKVRVHDEFLLSAKTKLSAREILFRSGLGDTHRFVEQALIIDADKETVNKLLTEVKCPLPPTHLAAFIAAEYAIILEEEGLEVAEEWKREIQGGVKRNYREIDEMVQRFYLYNFQVVDDVPEGKPARNTRGYDPAYLPSQQGLPDIDSELERVGIKTKELQRTVDEVMVFDVDGVLTIPDERLFDREVMEHIAQVLKRGEPVILNTGRSISWLQEKIVARLYHAHNLTDVTALQNLFMIAEKGGAWMGFNERGLMDPVPHRDASVSVPESLQKKVREIVSDEFANTMFFDETKVSMISVEMNEGIDLKNPEQEEMFREGQKRLVERLKQLLKSEGLDTDLKIDPTTIATDIQNKHVGKDFAMQRAVAWLKQRHIFPKKYITFGDSESDFAMAQHLHQAGSDVEHVHVGKSAIPEGVSFPVVITEGKYNKGTNEYLKSKEPIS